MLASKTAMNLVVGGNGHIGIHSDFTRGGSAIVFPVGKLQDFRHVGCSSDYGASLILPFVVVGSEGDAAQSVAIGIVGDLCGHGIDGYRLEDGLHGLGGIHSDCCLGIGADGSTRLILPLLEGIAEVFGGLQRHGCTFLVLLHVGVACDGACPLRSNGGGEHILRHLSGSTDEGALDDEVADACRAGALNIQKGERQFQRCISSSRHAGNFLTELGGVNQWISLAAAQIYSVLQHLSGVAGLDGKGEMRIAGIELSCQETDLGRHKREAVLGVQRQADAAIVVGNG